jgi:hypothetical protein
VQSEGEADDSGGHGYAIAFEGRAIARHPRNEALQHFEMLDAKLCDLLGWHYLIQNQNLFGNGFRPLGIQGCVIDSLTLTVRESGYTRRQSGPRVRRSGPVPAHRRRYCTQTPTGKPDDQRCCDLPGEGGQGGRDTAQLTSS